LFQNLYSLIFVSPGLVLRDYIYLRYEIRIILIIITTIISKMMIVITTIITIRNS